MSESNESEKSEKMLNDERKEGSRRRWISVVGFLISVTLMSLAVFLSINQEKSDRLAKLNSAKEFNSVELSSKSASKSINEVRDEIEKNAIASSDVNSYNDTALDDTSANATSNSVGASANLSDLLKNEASGNSASSASSDKTAANDSANSDKSISNKKGKAASKSSNSSNNQSQNSAHDSSNQDEQEPKKSFIKPVDGDVSKEFSMDGLVYSETLQEWVTHGGIDIKANLDSDVKCVADGTVKSIKNDPRYGLSITVEHKNGFSSIYTCLLSTTDVKEGDKVIQGQVIGKVGNSGVFEVADGSHLHFEMKKSGQYINPEMYLK